MENSSNIKWEKVIELSKWNSEFKSTKKQRRKYKQ